MADEIERFQAALALADELGPQMAFCLSRIRVLDSGCWEWTASISAAGYGTIKRERSSRMERAHRVVYKMLVGPVPDDLDLDHLCHDPIACTLGTACPHRRCVNPTHLAPTTRSANVMRGGGRSAINARKTHCPQGHPYTPENLLNRKRSRDCRICHAAAERRRKAARRQ